MTRSGMARWVLLAAVVLLFVGLAAAEPKPVDSDWLRSDDVPVEIETAADAPPETATPDPQTSTSLPIYIWVVLGVICLATIAVWILWGKNR